MPDPVKDNVTPTEAPKATVQDRINQVTRQKHDAERQVNGLETANTALEADNQTLRSQIATLTQAPAPVPQMPHMDPLGGAFGQTLPQHVAPAPAAGGLDPAALSQMVATAVADAIKPVTSAISAGQRQTSLQAEFNAAAAECPALNDPKSEVYKAWEQVWNGRPELATISGGMALSVAAAQGLVGGGPSASEIDARKTAATTVTPAGGQAVLLAQPTDVKKAGELANQLLVEGSEKGLDKEGWEALLSAKLGAMTPE